MARLARLVLPGEAHYLILRAHSGLSTPGICVDAIDRSACLAALHEAGAAERVHIHAYALLPDELQLLATPEDRKGLSRLVQAVGRRYVSAYNRRHGRSGTLWDGRYRCSVVEAGTTRLNVLRLIDGLSSEPGITSAGHHSGGQRLPLLRDLPEIWALGNTPFEREAAYRTVLAQGLPPAVADGLRQSALGGWAAGSAAFTAEVAAACERPARPRPRGRPRGTPA
jgi:putative transposase